MRNRSRRPWLWSMENDDSHDGDGDGRARGYGLQHPLKALRGSRFQQPRWHERVDLNLL
jgi:hypothetical protein